MSNTLRWAGQLAAGGVVRLPFAGVASAMTHPRDIAAVALAALTEPGHDGVIHTLSGPESLTPPAQVAVVADVLGRPLELVPQTNEEAWADMSATTPMKYVEAFFDFYVNGSLDESPVLPTVSAVTGRPARTLREWVVEHRSQFPDAS